MYYSGNTGKIWTQYFTLWREDFEYTDTIIQWFMRPDELIQEDDHLMFEVEKLGS